MISNWFVTDGDMNRCVPKECNWGSSVDIFNSSGSSSRVLSSFLMMRSNVLKLIVDLDGAEPEAECVLSIGLSGYKRGRRVPEVIAYACGGEPGNPFASKSTTHKKTLTKAINPEMTGRDRWLPELVKLLVFSVDICLQSVKSSSSTSWGSKNSQSVRSGSKLRPVWGIIKDRRSWLHKH